MAFGAAAWAYTRPGSAAAPASAAPPFTNVLLSMFPSLVVSEIYL
jgi:hypothetical protein